MELTINDRIRQRKIDFFNSFKISLRYDSIASTFSFDFYYDPEVQEQKDMACIGHYHLCQLRHNGELFLTGQILSEGFEHPPVRQLVTIGGYSLPGVLGDCQIPTNGAIDQALKAKNLKLPVSSPSIPYTYPLQSDSISIRQIAQKLIAPFGLTMVVDPAVASAMDEPIEETTAKPRDTIQHYLTELATQKNINITHDEKGQLLFTRVKAYFEPILNFNVPKGGLPGIKMKLGFNGQAMHSQITVLKQGDIDDDDAGESTVTNPFVPYVFRPRTIIQSSGNEIDTGLAAKQALAAELRSLSLTVTIDRWDVNNKLVKPNNTITVINPEIYIFKKTEFFIESIDFTGDQKAFSAILHCVLKSVYDGSDPVYIFAGINTH